MTISNEALKLSLMLGDKIPFEDCFVYQPTIEEYKNSVLGIDSYFIYKYYFCISIKHLGLSEEFIKELNDKQCSFFQTMFILDGLMKVENKLNDNTSFLARLLEPLSFYLHMDIINFDVDYETQRIIVKNNEKKDVLILSNDNFEDFSALIRMICSSEKFEIPKKEKNPYYQNETLRKKFEKILRQNAETEEKKKLENAVTLADIIGRICVNKDTKYDYFNISRLTLWQLFYEYGAMYVLEGNSFEIRKISSGNFDYSKTKIDLDWGKKIKIKIPNLSFITN